MKQIGRAAGGACRGASARASRHGGTRAVTAARGQGRLRPERGRVRRHGHGAHRRDDERADGATIVAEGRLRRRTADTARLGGRASCDSRRPERHSLRGARRVPDSAALRGRDPRDRATSCAGRGRDSRRRCTSVAATWTPLVVSGRVAQSDLAQQQPPFRADTTPPPAGYRFRPATLAALLDILAAVLVACAVGLAGLLCCDLGDPDTPRRRTSWRARYNSRAPRGRDPSPIAAPRRAMSHACSRGETIRSRIRPRSSPGHARHRLPTR